MLRRKRVGLLIWGTIFLIASGIFFATDEAAGFIVGLFVLTGAILMLVFGILNVISVTKHNNTLVAENLDYRAQCPNCARDINARVQDFRPHGRFPEGFIYCPICKKPVSKNAFQPYRRDTEDI